MRKKLDEIINRGIIRNEEDFRIFWLFHEKVDEFIPGITSSTKITVHLLFYGHAVICVEDIIESELTLENFCRFYCKPNEPIVFYDYNNKEYPSFEALQASHVEKILQEHKRWIGDEFTIEFLNSHCSNGKQWANGGNYTTFMDEGLLMIGDFEIGNSYKTMYAKIKPLSDYKVTKTKGYRKYKDCYVLVEDVYMEDAKEE